ncbi:permease prefix domain 1-containing protein [Luedemannella flava]
MTTPTLTDRYVDATLRRLPERQRADIERELRASIEDAVEARVDGGEDPADAERAVLTGLGDPARLAAGYSTVRCTSSAPRSTCRTPGC